MIQNSIRFNPRNHVYVSGLVALLTFGTLGLVAACLAVFWLVLQFVLLAFQSITECSQAIDTTFQAADPLIKFFMLLAVGYALYRVVRRFNWRI